MLLVNFYYPGSFYHPSMAVRVDDKEIGAQSLIEAWSKAEKFETRDGLVTYVRFEDVKQELVNLQKNSLFPELMESVWPDTKIEVLVYNPK